MDKNDILIELHALPHPITERLVVFDDGCEFNILTPLKGVACFAGGAFPISGPFRLSRALHAELHRMLSLRGEGGLEDAILRYAGKSTQCDYLTRVIHVLGADAIEDIVRVNWPARRAFYVFHNMGTSESAMYSSLTEAYAHFINIFAGKGNGAPWEDMDEDELCQYHEGVEAWRARGSKRLPPRNWLGSYQSPLDGTMGRVGISRRSK